MDKRSCRWPLQNSPGKTARLPVSASSLSRSVDLPWQLRSISIHVRTWPRSQLRTDFVFPVRRSEARSLGCRFTADSARDHSIFPQTDSQATPSTLPTPTPTPTSTPTSTRRYVKSANLAANPRHAFHVNAAAIRATYDAHAPDCTCSDPCGTGFDLADSPARSLAQGLAWHRFSEALSQLAQMRSRALRQSICNAHGRRNGLREIHRQPSTFAAEAF